MKYLKAIAFDIDNTLYPDSSLYLPSLPLLWRYWSFLQVYRKLRKRLRKMQYDLSEKGVDFATWEAQLFKEMAGSHEDVESIKNVIESFYADWLIIFRKAKPFKNMLSTLKTLYESGYQIGFLSDLAIANRLEVLGVQDLARVAFSSQETGYLKPHKAPFERLIKEFSCQPEEILYVGNSYCYDILGAYNCGMRSAHLTRKPVKNSLADFSFSQYADLQAFIDKLSGSE